MNDIEVFIKNRVEQVGISCKTFIVTVFGDVVSQHGDWIWLGSLIESLASFGYSERLVRTSVFRLVEDDWLKVQKVGRKSYYCLTQNANNHNTKAARRIYAPSNISVSDDWLIVIPSFVADEELIRFRRQIKWLGFSSISASVFAHPSFEKNSLDETLKELNLMGDVIIFSANTTDEQSSMALRKLVFQKWDLRELQSKYDLLIVDYKPILKLATLTKETNYQQSFQLRLLIIHEYRRILLKDHGLSKSMLPENWSGITAHQLVKELYASLEKNSNIYICDNLKSTNGFLPKSTHTFSNRFKSIRENNDRDE